MSSRYRASDPTQTAVASHADPVRAWSPYEPDSQRPWNLRRAGHLYRRATFGASWSQLQQAVKDGPRRTIDRLLRPTSDVDAFNSEYDEFEAASAGGDGVAELRGWWLRRMLATPHPLLEKMTLFWHGHFAATNSKVKQPRLILQHVQMLRGHALGRFEPMLIAASSDPAILTTLGSTANRKSQPNEDHARALIENFGMGSSGFTAEDVQGAARAFTGLFVLRNQLKYFQREHDTGVKTVFGEKGDFRGEDVVRILLQQPQSAQFLVRKLYREFISEVDEPNDQLIQPLVDAWNRDYDILGVVETMLRSNLFFSDHAFQRRVKSPVEYALGIVQAMDNTIPTLPLGAALTKLGQGLYTPPSIQGWPSGQAWINSATLLARSTLAESLLSTEKPYGGRLDPVAVADRYSISGPDQSARFFVELMLQNETAGDHYEGLVRRVASILSDFSDRKRQLRQAIQEIVMYPEFQLA